MLELEILIYKSGGKYQLYYVATCRATREERLREYICTTETEYMAKKIAKYFADDRKTLKQDVTFRVV